MENDTCFAAVAKKEVRTTHQYEGSPFAVHLQDMRPCGLKLVAFGEANGVMPIERRRPIQRPGLLSQRLQFLGPALGPLSFIPNHILRKRGPHGAEGDCGKERSCSFHRDSSIA